MLLRLGSPGVAAGRRAAEEVLFFCGSGKTFEISRGKALSS